MSNNDDTSDDGYWFSNLTYFKDALKTLSQEEKIQVEIIGGDHSAWELRSDVIDFGEAIINLSEGRLRKDVREEISVLVTMLKELPEVAFQGDSFKALSHPQWSSIRSMAKFLSARI